MPLAEAPILPIARALALLGALLGVAGGAAAQFGSGAEATKLFGAGAGAASAAAWQPPAPTETPQQAIARIRRQLDRLGTPPAPPAGAVLREIETQRENREALSYIYQGQLRVYNELLGARGQRLQAEARARDWPGLTEPPPYSILMLDNLLEAQANARERIATLSAVSQHLKDDEARRAQDVRQAQESLRLAAEAAERAGPDDGLAAWRLEGARLQARRSAEWLRLAGLQSELRSDAAATHRAELQLLQRQIDAIGDKVSFTQQDLDRARKRLADDAERSRAELRALQGELASRVKAAEQAGEELAQLKGGGQAPAAQVAVAEARLRAARAWLEALRNEEARLQALITLSDELPDLWALRLSARSSDDADTRRNALRALRDGAAAVERWRIYQQTRVAEARADLRDAQGRLENAAVALQGSVADEREAAAAAQRAVMAHEMARDAVSRESAMLTRWVGELQSPAQRTLQVRLGDSWSAVREYVRDVWDFELISVEDSAIVDGHTVTTSRGVPVGKSIGAILLFVLGFSFAALLTGRMLRHLENRGVDVRKLRGLRRWLLAFIAVVLLLFTLNIAKIPLTVFAFLGGAVAIAVGFGMQTIFKNFISGIILLTERNIQIDDIIEVEGVTGTIVSVDLRSSTMLGFDGVETIVPNSQLLENRVTNWTHSNRRVRRNVKGGEDYASPVSEVAEILRGCAGEHGLVVAEPAPMVIFEDFADSALVLGLYFWVELGPKSSAIQVMSDLRFMIERRLREAGIVIAFPQRDVNLSSAAPVRVELVRPA
jgi:small-conductance mechanosensitive channel